MMKNVLQKSISLMLLAGITASSWAQLALVNSPYTQNFNAIGSGLPTGWDVRTGASASALGTSATLTTAATTWAFTTGQFRNVASATGLTSSTSAGDQAASTNRALAIRQTGGFGDPGGAFYVQLQNTVAKTGFKMDFLLQSLDVTSPRVVSWTVQFGIGASPTSFTTANSITGTVGTGGSTFSSNSIAVDFASQLDNINDIVWIRILPSGGSTATGNRPTTGIDDISISWAGATAPSISVSPSAINMGGVNLGSTSVNQQYNLTAANLNANLNVSVSAPFSISADGSSFGPTLSFTPAQMTNSQTIFVRFIPVAGGTQTADITHTSTGAADRSVALTGEGIDPLNPTFNFNTCTPLGAPGGGFTTFSAVGAQVWQCTSFGNNSTNGVQINGFSGGAVDNEDWLISPAFDLSSGFNIPVLKFWSRSDFSGPALQVLVSSNYSGAGDPNAATWTVLPANLPAVASGIWTLSDNIDLSAYKVNGVYVAFKYTSSPANGASRWTVDDVSLSSASQLVSVFPTSLQFGEQAAGTSSVGQAIQLTAKGIGNVTVGVNSGWQVSADNNTFSSAIIIPEATALNGVTFYARFSPTVKKLRDTGIVNIKGTGYDNNGVLLFGTSFPRNQTLDIAGWNMMFFGSNPTNNATLQFIAQQRQNAGIVFQQLQADLVGVSEVSNDAEFNGLMGDLTGFTSLLSPRWSYSFNPPDPNFPPQKIGFAYNNTTLTLTESRVMFEKLYDDARGGANTIPNYPNGTPSSFWASGRLPFMATFTTTIGGVSKTIKAIVIHAKSGGSSVDDYNRRVYDVQVLKDSIDAYYSNDNVVILGDYNDDMIVSIFNSQASPYKPFVDDVTRYDAITSGFTAAGKVTFVGGGASSAIDHHTLTTPLAGLYLAGSAGVEDPRSYISNYTSTTSDHLPVYSRYSFDVVLPVVMRPLQGYMQGNTAHLNWETVTETNSSHFVIEKSLDGRQFEAVGKVAARGNSTTKATYTWTEDGLSAGTYYYRLRQVDKDGRYVLTSVVTLRAMGQSSIAVYPNPVARNINISLPVGLTKAQWKLTSIDGRVIAAGNGAAATMARNLQLAIPALRSGYYLLQVQSNLGSETIKLIKE